MADDRSGISDGAQADLNPTGPDPDNGPQPDPIPDRPADGATKAKWADYCVALGADRTFITSDTEHFDADANEAVTEPALTRDELIELADRLGG
jgi:hypothetical protein